MQILKYTLMDSTWLFGNFNLVYCILYTRPRFKGLGWRVETWGLMKFYFSQKTTCHFLDLCVFVDLSHHVLMECIEVCACLKGRESFSINYTNFFLWIRIGLFLLMNPYATGFTLCSNKPSINGWLLPSSLPITPSVRKWVWESGPLRRRASAISPRIWSTALICPSQTGRETLAPHRED